MDISSTRTSVIKGIAAFVLAIAATLALTIAIASTAYAGDEPNNPHMTVVKTVTSTPANGSTYGVGETITYNIVVCNTGNVMLKDISVKDTMINITGPQPTLSPATIASLEPDANQIYTVAYTVLVTDAGATISNCAEATAVDPTDSAKTVTGTATTPGEPVTPTPTPTPGPEPAPGPGSKPAITITAASDEWTYDGTEHVNKAVAATGNLAEGDVLVAEATGSVTNVWDTQDGNNPIAEGYKVMRGDDDVTAEYAITAVAGTLTVKPAPVTVTANDVTKTYDGQAAAIDPEGVTIAGLVNGESQDAINYDLDFAEGVDKKNAGVTADAIDVSGKTDQGNYTVTFVDGTLTINPVQLTITANPQTYTYNGDVQGEGDTAYNDSALIAKRFTVTGLQGSDTVANVTLDGQGLDAGPYDLTPSEAAINTGKQENYTIDYVNGTLTINPATVTVTTQSASKTYDGTALTAPGTISGLAGDDAVTFTVTGSQTEVGSSSNTYTIAWGDVDQKNYKVEENLGTLTVNAAKATLAFDLGGGTLDGKTGTITIEANVGDKVNLPDAPTKDGYTFKCWKGSEYAAGAEYTVPEGGHEFTAEWEKNADSKSAVPATGDDAGMLAIPVSIVAGISLVVLIGSGVRRRAA